MNMLFLTSPSIDRSFVDEFLLDMNASRNCPETRNTSCFRFITWYLSMLPGEGEECFKFLNAL